MSRTKQLQPIEFQLDQALPQLADLGVLLQTHPTLDEKKEILPFFRERPQLSTMIGFLDPNLHALDRIGFEYDLFGDFRCDLVIGDSEHKTYLFIEFEDAKPHSIFKKHKKRFQPSWSNRFEQGYSQLVDWFWRLEDARTTQQFLDRFESNHEFSYEGMLIIGRDAFIDEKDRKRLKWRTDRVTVNAKHIRGYTYDELYRMLTQRLRRFQHYSQ